MKRWGWLTCVLLVAQVGHAAAVVSNGAGGGRWSEPGTWASKKAPADGDSVTIAAGDTVTFDADLSRWASGIAGLTCDGRLNCSTLAGSYCLKTSADVGGTGAIHCGSPTAAYPPNCTMTFDFGGKPNSFECGAGLVLNLYCAQPAHPVITLSTAAAAGQTELAVDTDVRGDLWAPGQTVRIDAVSGEVPDSELRVIATGPVNAAALSLGTGLARPKTPGAQVILVTRNVRIVASTDYVVKSMTDGVLACEISGCDRAVSSCSGTVISGTISGCSYGVSSGSGGVISGVLSGCSFAVASHAGGTISGLLSGCSYGVSASCGSTISGTIAGCSSALIEASGCAVPGTITGCTVGLYYSAGCVVSGTVTGCGSAVYAGTHTLRGAVFTNNLYDLRRVVSVRAYGTLFGSASENYEYDTDRVPAWNYVASYDHDGVPGAFRAWTRGGVIASDADTAPLGYGASYRHACTSATAPCFRQEAVTLGANQTLEVRGQVLILDNHTAWPPRLEIIDMQADPLLDPTATALASAALGSPRGRYYWQELNVAYTNTTAADKQVWIRCSAQQPGCSIYEVWSRTISP